MSRRSADERALTAFDRRVYGAIAALLVAREYPVAADDPVIYERVVADPRKVRMAILRLVERGMLVAGDGYLRLPERISGNVPQTYPRKS